MAETTGVTATVTSLLGTDGALGPLRFDPLAFDTKNMLKLNFNVDFSVLQHGMSFLIKAVGLLDRELI